LICRNISSNLNFTTCCGDGVIQVSNNEFCDNNYNCSSNCKDCAPNFYGPICNPCNCGSMKCLDGINGNGTCLNVSTTTTNTGSTSSGQSSSSSQSGTTTGQSSGTTTTSQSSGTTTTSQSSGTTTTSQSSSSSSSSQNSNGVIIRIGGIIAVMVIIAS